jgi:type I restriction enzyme R subunit
VRKLAATQGKRFAVIADEAHSSQTGEAAAKLKEVLSAGGDRRAGRWRRGEHRRHPRVADGGEGRGLGHHLRRVHGDAQEQDDGDCSARARIPRASPPPTTCRDPFHVYSMRQAIEEKFILDVLAELHALQPRVQARPRRQGDRRQRGGAQRGHEEDHGLGEAPPVQHRPEGQIVVEHYRAHVAPLLGGRAKAMVVVASRLEAVRWQLAIEKYIKQCGYKIGTSSRSRAR